MTGSTDEPAGRRCLADGIPASTLNRPRRGHRGIAIGAGIAGVALAAGIALAVAPLPTHIFQISDANVVHDSGPGVAPVDWADVFSGSGGSATTLPTVDHTSLSPLNIGGSTVTPVTGTQTFIRDALAFDPLTAPWQSEACTNATSTNKGDTTVFTGAGSEKNGDPLSTMTWGAGSIPNNKDDLGNLYATAYKNSEGHVIIYFAGERVDNLGSAFLDVEFLHSPVARTVTGYNSTGCPQGSFSGTRTDGDIIIGLTYQQQPGGKTPAKLGTPQVFEYSTTAGGYVPATGLPPNTIAVFSNNQPIDCGTWLCRTSSATQLTSQTAAASQFFEGYIDTGNLPQPLTGCLNTFFGHTRSSNPITSTLKDFAQGTFTTCTTGLVTAPSATTVVAGTSVTDTATLSLGGGLGGVQPAPTGTIAFGVCPGAGTCTTSTTGYISLGDGSALSGAGTSYTSTSAAFDTTGKSGTFCFLGRYVPGASDAYPAASDGSANECFNIVNGTISVSPTATNSVGRPHTFTFSATATGNATPSKIVITPTISDPTKVTANTCADPTSTGSTTASCTVIVDSSTATQITASGTADFYYSGSKLFSRSTDGSNGNSGTATKTYVDARIHITPSATNSVGRPHTFTILLEEDLGLGGGWVPFAGQSVTATQTAGSCALTPSDGQVTTDANGQATVSVNSSAAGQCTVSAAFSGDIVPGDGNTAVTRTTDGTGNDGPAATKTYVDARIHISPNGTNFIYDSHTFTIHLERNLGSAWSDFAGQSVTASISSDTANSSFTGSPTCTTDSSGTCTVAITSDRTGTTVVSAAFSGDIVPGDGNTNVTRTTGDGVSGDGDSATKTWVAAKISISPNGTNAVGVHHTFTVHLDFDLGDGSGFVAASGRTVSTSVTSGTCTFVGASSGTTNASGNLDVTITSSTPQVCQVAGSFSGDIVPTVDTTAVDISTDGTGGSSGPATKTYVDARIHISPNGTNFIYDSHTFTIHLERNLGSAWSDFAGQSVTASISSDTANSSFTGSPTCTTDSSGTCTVAITSDRTGTTVVSAAFSGDIVPGDGNTNVTRTTGDGVSGDGDSATKVWKSAQVTLTKTFEVGPLTSPGQACFTLTRTSPTGAGTPPLSTDVATQCDTGASISFTWHNLVAGDYTIAETTTPAGYTKMADINFTVAAGDFSSGNLSQSFTRNDPLNPGTLKIAKTILDSSNLGIYSFEFTVQPCGSDSKCATPGTSLGTFTVDNTHNPVTVGTNLSEGYYLVTELPATGFTPETPTQIASVPAGSTVTVTFNNRPSSYSQLAPTQTTCQQFAAGTASTESVITYGVKSGVINNVAPGVLFYYTKVNALANGTFTFDMVQTNDQGYVLFGVKSVQVFDASCNTVSATVSTPSAGVVRVSIAGATTGQTYFANIKLDPSTVTGLVPPSPTILNFTYATKIGGTTVSSASGTLQPK